MIWKKTIELKIKIDTNEEKYLFFSRYCPLLTVSSDIKDDTQNMK